MEVLSYEGTYFNDGYDSIGDVLDTIPYYDEDFVYYTCTDEPESSCEPCPQVDFSTWKPLYNELWDNQSENRPAVRFSKQKRNTNSLSINVGDSAHINIGIDLDTNFYSRYEARVTEDSRSQIAISYAGDNVPVEIVRLTPESAKSLKVYGLSEGTAAIEIWAISSWGDEVCIAGDEAIHGSTAIFDKLVVDVTP